MNPIELMLKVGWRNLFHVHNEGTKPQRYHPEWEQIAERLKRAADTFDRVEQARKTMEAACKSNGGLPF